MLRTFTRWREIPFFLVFLVSIYIRSHISSHLTFSYYAAVRRKGGIKHCFCLSVRPSVAFIANNSRTRRRSALKFGMKVHHLWCDLQTNFQVQRSKVKVTRPINADTQRTSNLVYGWRTTTRISHRRQDLQGQRSRSQGHVISLRRLLYLCY